MSGPHPANRAHDWRSRRTGGRAAIIGVVLVGGAIVLMGIWAGLVLLFAPIVPAVFRLPAAALTGVVAAAALVRLRRPGSWIAGCALIVLVASVALRWGWLTPSSEAAWIAEVARQPTATISGERVTVRNVRNFNWRTETDFDERWEERTYDLGRLRRLDLLLSYWAGDNIAHVILSFGFDDGEQLAASIETRRHVGQEYSAAAGFFRNYELTYVVADERDVVRLRTNVRGERVYLYRLRAPPEAVRRLFLEYLSEINELARKPRFYNTLTTNCTTQVRFAAIAAGAALPWSWRLLLSGHMPEYLYDQGSVDVRLPLPELRRRSEINAAAREADPDPLFSRRIRDGRPDPLS